MKKKKKNQSNLIDVIYICVLLCIMIILLLPKAVESGNSDGCIPEPLTYCLYGEGGGEIESWVVLVPDSIWVNDDGDCGTYSYKNGRYTFFLNDKKLCTAQLTDGTLAVETEDGDLLRFYPKENTLTTAE